VILVPNISLERIGEKLVVIESAVASETEVLNQQTVPSTRLTLS
jgi:hypothetical protein